MNGNGMKQSFTFRDQVDLMLKWFQDWTPCEQTIAIYTLLSKVDPSHARFLFNVLESITKRNSEDLEQLEADANDPNVVNSLHGLPHEEALDKLLSHIPLIKPGCAQVVREYMTLLPNVLLSDGEDPSYFNKCRQLLSIALVHPAFQTEDQNSLTYWLQHLDEKWRRYVETGGPKLVIQQSNGFAGPSVTAATRTSTWPKIIQSSPRRNGDGDDIIPLKSHSSVAQKHPLKTATNGESSNSHEAIGSFHRRLSEDDQSSFEPGMKNIEIWLKHLRLHKYQDIFLPLTFDEMMELSEEYLEQKGVTKGARNKIVQQIKALSMRSEHLYKMEKEIIEAKQSGKADPIFFIEELNGLLIQPIKPFHGQPFEESDDQEQLQNGSLSQKESPCSGSSSDEDSSSPDEGSDHDQEDYAELLLKKKISKDNLPVLIARIMYRVYDLVYVPTSGVEEAISAFVKLVDRALSNDCFQNEEVKLFDEWKRQCKSNLKLLVPSRKRRGRGSFGSNTFGGVSSRGGTGGSARKTNTVGRPLRLKGNGFHPGGGARSSTLPTNRQAMIGPFQGGLPVAQSNYSYGGDYNGSHMDGRYGPKTLDPPRQGEGERGYGLRSRFGSGGSPRIKSKEIVSQDMTDLCVRVAETAISDDFDDLDGMSFSLSGKGKRM